MQLLACTPSIIFRLQAQRHFYHLPPSSTPLAKQARVHMRILLFYSTAVVATFAFTPSTKNARSLTLCSISTASPSDVLYDAQTCSDDLQWIIQWRGEGTEGYSTTLRQWEFSCAFKAEVADYWNDSAIHSTYLDGIQFEFRDALTYQGPVFHPDTVQNEEVGEPIPESQVSAYESGMQYLAVQFPSSSDYEYGYSTHALTQLLQNTIKRCSLVRNGFLVVAKGNSYDELASIAMDNGSFNDIIKGGSNEDDTWSIRLRRYGPEPDNNNDGKKRRSRQARYGKNVRSPLSEERKAIFEMKDLVELFHGKVNLSKPDCKIYLFDGLKNNMVSNRRNSRLEGSKCLARAIAKGPKTSIYAPKTRICVTTTPLCPIAAFTMCNVAQLRPHFSVLDPFAGSCASLFAAAHIATYSSRTTTKSQGGTVSIEVAHNGLVNRDDIRKDFETRSLLPPLEIIHGDSMKYECRQQARRAIGGGAFDCIVTDPPYGIREAFSGNSDGEEQDNSLPPLTQFIYAMGRDRLNNTPLLKVGGRLVAFIPVRKGETLEECLPESHALEQAGLVMECEGREQVLNDILSRWLVSFVCVS